VRCDLSSVDVSMKFDTSVNDIIPRTHNVKSFRFPRPKELQYKAGQFMFVKIKSGDEEMRKHFTISSSPTEKDHIEFTKKLTGSDFSNALDATQRGDWAMIDAPYGKFTFEGEYPKIGMLSGGIGITPLRSICRYCTDMQLDTKITLLYGNLTERDIAFRKELTEMQERNRNLKVVFTLDQPTEDWTGHKGYINVQMVKKEIPDYMDRVFYVCGPPGMTRAMENLLRDLNLPKTQIKREIFSGY